MTNRDLVLHLRQPGKVEMPVLTATDVIHIIVEKTDLIERLTDLGLDSEAAWAFVCDASNGIRTLDVRG